MKKIDYSEIITVEEYLNMDYHSFLNYMSFGNMLNEKRPLYRKERFKYRIAKEVIETGIGFKEYDMDKRALSVITSNYIFNNNELFIQMLSNKGITYEKLSKFAKVISIAKKSKISIRYEEALNSLAHMIYIMTNVSDYNIIYNKINQIIAFNRDLYKKIDKQK